MRLVTALHMVHGARFLPADGPRFDDHGLEADWCLVALDDDSGAVLRWLR